MNKCQLAIHPGTLSTMSTLADYIKARRDLLGWTQQRLGEEAGLTKSHLSQIEGGKIALPSAEIRRRLAKALGVRHIDLLIAAGEITPEEADLAKAAGNPFAIGDARHEAVELLLSNDPAFTSVVHAVVRLRHADQRGPANTQ